MKLNADELILQALREDITSEDITTNAVLPKPCEGQVDLICKQDGILAGIDVFRRVFDLLDENTQTEAFAKAGDPVKKGMKIAVVTVKLSAADERHRHLHQQCRRFVEGKQNKAAGHKKNHAEYAGV